MMYSPAGFTYWFMLSLYFVNADDFKYVRFRSFFLFNTIRRDRNTSISTNTYSAISLAHCSYKCGRHSSISLYFDEQDQTCQCNNNVDVSTVDYPNKPEIIYGYFDKFIEISKYREFTKFNTIPRRPNCFDLLQSGFSEDGVYTIQPTRQDHVDIWCDMQDGGWTVFQRRLDGSEDIYRGWSDYVSGFGNRTGEYWFGLDNLHALTTEASELYIYVEAFEDMNPLSAYAHYTIFTVDGQSLNYRLHVGGYSGSCEDMFLLHGNNTPFTTFDRDHDDLPDDNCAEMYHGAWWYRSCHDANLNGYYYGGYHDSTADGVNVYECWGDYYSVKQTVMKVRKTS